MEMLQVSAEQSENLAAMIQFHAKLKYHTFFSCQISLKKSYLPKIWQQTKQKQLSMEQKLKYRDWMDKLIDWKSLGRI